MWAVVSYPTYVCTQKRMHMYHGRRIETHNRFEEKAQIQLKVIGLSSESAVKASYMHEKKILSQTQQYTQTEKSQTVGGDTGSIFEEKTTSKKKIHDIERTEKDSPSREKWKSITRGWHSVTDLPLRTRSPLWSGRISPRVPPTSTVGGSSCDTLAAVPTVLDSHYWTLPHRDCC